jgi:hypothetical protein
MNTPRANQSFRDGLSRITLNGSLGASLAALIVGVVVVLTGLSAIVSAAFGPGVGKIQPQDEMNALVAQHNEKLQLWQDRLNGRSPFFKPPAPVVVQKVEPKPEPVRISEPVKDPGPPPRYEGPPIAFAYADVVYFNSMNQGDGKVTRVRVGEEQSGLRVISTSLPWTVKVGFKGGEYDVPLFNRSDQSAFVKGPSEPVIIQDSFIVAVSPQPEVVVPPPSSPAPEAAVTQAAAMPGDGAAQTHRRGQPARAVPQRQPQAQPGQRTPRGAPPENAPPQPAEEQPIEESGVEEPAEEDDGPVEEDPESEQQEEPQPPNAPPPPPPPQSPQADNADSF